MYGLQTLYPRHDVEDELRAWLAISHDDATGRDGS